MKLVRIISGGVIAAWFVTGAAWAQDEDPAGGAAATQVTDDSPTEAEQATDIDDLIESIRTGTSADTVEFNRLRTEFVQRQNEQTRLVEQARADRDEQLAISERLNDEYDANETRKEQLQDLLTERLGSLNELFGVLAQFAGDAGSSFHDSLTNVEFPEREQWLAEFAEKMGNVTELPSISEIERLWYELAREASELGKVKRLPNQRVVLASGEETQQDIVRVGAFNLVGDGRYFTFEPETNSIKEIQRQPSQARYIDSTTALLNAGPNDDLVRFGIDVTRGQLLTQLIRMPDTVERIQQGKTVGYVIIVLGILGVLLSIERLITLGIAGRKVKSQLKSDTPKKNNALGRVLMVYEANKSVDTETLELKLGEAILKEQPPVQRGILFIKIISVVAPLLGLLGTVVGMINVFQQIMLFGAGDASRMAGGISQALVTTMLGLIVAIPMVLLHTVVSGSSRRIMQILQEQSAGMVARQAEKSG